MSNDYIQGNDVSTDTATNWYGYVPVESALTWGVLTISGSQEPEREKNMRSLFRITVVNPKTEKIFPETKVIARDRESALLRADLPGEVRANPDKYDILVEHVGDVRAKKDVQKVKVVKEEEE